MLVRIRLSILLSLVLTITTISTAIAEQPTSSADAQQTKRYAALEKSLTGATMVGYFTDSNAAPTKLTADRYDLKSVRHLGEDQWLFQTRIRYGDHDLTLPLTLPIHWAGDTPVITVEKLVVPGLGTFSARVMIYDNHYAGFWSGADHGGHMFGKIEHESKNEPEKGPPK